MENSFKKFKKPDHMWPCALENKVIVEFRGERHERWINSCELEIIEFKK